METCMVCWCVLCELVAHQCCCCCFFSFSPHFRLLNRFTQIDVIRTAKWNSPVWYWRHQSIVLIAILSFNWVFACMCVCECEWVWVSVQAYQVREALPVSLSTFPFIHEFNRSKLYKILHSIFFPSAHPPNEAHLLEIRKHIRLAATPLHTYAYVCVYCVHIRIYLVCILYVELFFRCYYFYHYYCYGEVGERNT